VIRDLRILYLGHRQLKISRRVSTLETLSYSEDKYRKYFLTLCPKITGLISVSKCHLGLSSSRCRTWTPGGPSRRVQALLEMLYQHDLAKLQ